MSSKRKGQKKEDQEKKKKGSLTSQIRGIERLLKRENIPESVKKQKRAELKELYRTKAKVQKEKKEKLVSAKYKSVKFFEKRKLVRKIEQLQKKLQNKDLDSQQREELENKLTQAQRNLRYVRFYPKAEPYISLFPSSGTLDQATLEKQEAIKKQIEEDIASGKIIEKPLSAKDKDKDSKHKPKVEEEKKKEPKPAEVLDPQQHGEFVFEVEKDPFFIVEEQEATNNQEDTPTPTPASTSSSNNNTKASKKRKQPEATKSKDSNNYSVPNKPKHLKFE